MAVDLEVNVIETELFVVETQPDYDFVVSTSIEVVGPEGPEGPQGIPGDAVVSQTTHTQGSLSTTWNITHSLGFRPNVMVINGADGLQIFPDIEHTSDTTIVVTHAQPYAGKAHLS